VAEEYEERDAFEVNYNAMGVLQVELLLGQSTDAVHIDTNLRFRNLLRLLPLVSVFLSFLSSQR
jgi:hypothetical protein